MGQISLTLPADGQSIEAADVNNPFNAILNEFNGNIDNDNIKTAAGILGSKLATNSLPPTVYDANSRAGWNISILPAPNTITYNGNRSYSLVFNSTDLTSYISAGMRLRTTRTVAAPNQCTSLNGSTQYWVKTSPNKLTFTDDFTISAWVKVNSYSSFSTIVSRYNNTSGWQLSVETSGQVSLYGYNAGSSNFSRVISNASVPLGKWVHITAQLDMSSFTATSTTSYVMFDGVDSGSAVSRGGTNPTALVQAGNLEIGSSNGGSVPFNGKIAQVAIYNSKITQSTIQTTFSQGLAGTETGLASAYSFSNAVTDLNTTTPNDLSVGGGSAVATNADSPFGNQADGTISTTLDYGIVMLTAFSTNTTLTVQVPEGCTIPTSGGVSAVAYSVHKSPYGMPLQRDKWVVTTISTQDSSQSSPVNGTWYNLGGNLLVPIGSWNLSYTGGLNLNSGSSQTDAQAVSTLSTGASSETDLDFDSWIRVAAASATLRAAAPAYREKGVSLSVATTYYLNAKSHAGSISTVGFNGTTGNTIIRATNAYL